MKKSSPHFTLALSSRWPTPFKCTKSSLGDSRNRPRQISASFVAGVKVPGRYGDGRGGYGLSLGVGVNNRQAVEILGTAAQDRGAALQRRPWFVPRGNTGDGAGRALENARLVAQDGDPRIPLVAVPTFAQAVDEVIAHCTRPDGSTRRPKGDGAQLSTPTCYQC